MCNEEAARRTEMGVGANAETEPTTTAERSSFPYFTMVEYWSNEVCVVWRRIAERRSLGSGVGGTRWKDRQCNQHQHRPTMTMDLEARSEMLPTSFSDFPGKGTAAVTWSCRRLNRTKEEAIAKDMSNRGAQRIPGASDLRISNLCTSSKFYARRNQYYDLSKVSRQNPPSDIRMHRMIHDHGPWTDSNTTFYCFLLLRTTPAKNLEC